MIPSNQRVFIGVRGEVHPGDTLVHTYGQIKHHLLTKQASLYCFSVFTNCVRKLGHQEETERPQPTSFLPVTPHL